MPEHSFNVTYGAFANPAKNHDNSVGLTASSQVSGLSDKEMTSVSIFKVSVPGLIFDLIGFKPLRFKPNLALLQ